MKNIVASVIVFLFAGISVLAQVSINTDNSAPDGSAMLDVKSTAKGMLVPRMTAAERDGISQPATGLLLFCTDDKQYYTNKGTTASPNWAIVSSQWLSNGSDIYYTGGNVGIGTSPDYPLHFAGNLGDKISLYGSGSYHYGIGIQDSKLQIFSSTANSDVVFGYGCSASLTETMRIKGTGQVGIGTTNPGTRLDVAGVTRSSTTDGSTAGSGQFQAFAGGTGQGQRAVYSFYPTFMATPADNAARRAADILSGFNEGNWGNEYLAFHVGKNEVPNDNENLTIERMRIAGNGSIGIGTTSPAASAALDISSTTKGFLPPRMTLFDREAITSLTQGLVIYCTNCGTNGELQVYNGTAWTNMIGGAISLIGGSLQGGIIAYIFQPGDPGYIAGEIHGLIAAPSDQSTAAEWGCDYDTIAGADGTAIGTGNQNTIDIMAGCPTAGIAARICGDLVLNSYSDWYLPSKDELNKLYINRDVIGGFASNNYWSSSEYSAIGAWYQNFANGTQPANTKAWTYYVRAVRTF